jgi:hypothetical protein
VVDDCQVPDFLNLDNPKIKIVKHSEIIDEQYLPVFNSAPIEASIHHIPGLSENFLYSNDDMFFGDFISKSDVYNKCYWCHEDDKFYNPPEMSPSDAEWTCGVKNGYWLLKDKYPEAQLIIPAHVVHFCKKSLMYEIEHTYPEVYESTMNQKVRKGKDDDDCKTIVLHKMQCILGACKGIYDVIPSNNKIYLYYEMLDNKHVDRIKEIVDRTPKFFCINNISNYSEEVDEALSKRFNFKSPYEI